MSTSPQPDPQLDDRSPITVVMISRGNREKFDEDVRALVGVDTPMPPISEAMLAETDKDVAGFAYIQLAYHVEPWMTAEGAPPETLARLAEAIEDHLRTLIAVEGAPPDSDRILTYDLYVPAGTTVVAPPGFERVPVEVWRKRVI